MEREGKPGIDPALVDEVFRVHGRLGVGDRLRYRVKNMSEGVAIGSHRFISEVQRRLNRKFIHPRAFIARSVLFSTRVFKAKQ